MGKTLPHLGSKGYIDHTVSPSDILAMEFAHIFESDKSQSTLWNGSVVSVQWLIKEFGHEPEEMARQLQTALRDLYGKYYSTLDIVVRPSEVETDDGTYGLDLYVEVTHEERKYQLNRALLVDPSEEIAKVVQAINS